MRTKRIKIGGASAVYHCMTRTVNGEMLFEDREKEMLRKMLWQAADFSGVEILTYCIMSNHFHVLVHVPELEKLSDSELMRRYKVLYPKPTKFQTASTKVMEEKLQEEGDEAEVIRRKLLARMGDVSEFMKTVKQRFSVWFNRNHRRYGTLWADRFKSVLVEGSGNPLQTMAAYIDLNPVRANIVEDPKGYRFCGYAEAVAGERKAKLGLDFIWAGSMKLKAMKDENHPFKEVLQAHRMLIFGKGSSPWTHKGKLITHEAAVKVLEKEQGQLPTAILLRCRVRYFTDGAVLGSAEFVRGFTGAWQRERGRKYPPKVNEMRGTDWGDLAVIQSLRRQIFG
ncbi:MAG: putative transposase [Lentimonas sp.]|jgi:putative transposase